MGAGHQRKELGEQARQLGEYLHQEQQRLLKGSAGLDAVQLRWAKVKIRELQKKLNSLNRQIANRSQGVLPF